MAATFTIWALSDKMRLWLPIETGLSGEVAVINLATRQDVVRRHRYNTQFKVLPDGELP